MCEWTLLIGIQHCRDTGFVWSRNLCNFKLHFSGLGKSFETEEIVSLLKLSVLLSDYSKIHHSPQVLHTRLMALSRDYPGEPVPERKNQSGFYWSKRVSGSGISWAICKYAHCSRQTNHTSTPPLSFLQAGCPSCRPTNSVKALKVLTEQNWSTSFVTFL